MFVVNVINSFQHLIKLLGILVFVVIVVVVVIVIVVVVVVVVVIICCVLFALAVAIVLTFRIFHGAQTVDHHLSWTRFDLSHKITLRKKIAIVQDIHLPQLRCPKSFSQVLNPLSNKPAPV